MIICLSRSEELHGRFKRNRENYKSWMFLNCHFEGSFWLKPYSGWVCHFCGKSALSFFYRIRVGLLLTLWAVTLTLNPGGIRLRNMRPNQIFRCLCKSNMFMYNNLELMISFKSPSAFLQFHWSHWCCFFLEIPNPSLCSEIEYTIYTKTLDFINYCLLLAEKSSVFMFSIDWVSLTVLSGWIPLPS